MRTFSVQHPNRAPFVTVHYIDNTGQQVELTDSIEDFTFDEDVEEDDFIELQIKEDFGLKILNDKAIDTGLVLYFQFGYISGMASLVKSAKIAEIDTTYDVRVKVTIRCTDIGLSLKKSSSSKIWRNMTGAQIAKEIAKKYNIDSVIEDSGYVFKEVAQGNMPDFSFLKYLGTREPNVYLSYCTSAVLYYVKRGINKRSLVTFNFGVDEVIKFNPRINEVPVDKANLGAVSVGVDPRSKKTIVGQSTEDTPEVIGGETVAKTANSYEVIDFANKGLNKLAKAVEGEASAESWISSAKDVLNGIKQPVSTSPDIDPKALEYKAKGKKKKARMSIMVADLETQGNPLITINEVITMSNVATKHEGNWYITGISHHIGNSSYVTSIRLKKDAYQGAKKDTVTNNKTIGKNVEDQKSTKEIKEVIIDFNR